MSRRHRRTAARQEQPPAAAPQLDEETRRLLTRYLHLAGELHARLAQAEHAAALGRPAPTDAPIITGHTAHGLEQRLTPDGAAVVDTDLHALRRADQRRRARLRRAVVALEADLGYQAPRGLVDDYGRPRIQTVHGDGVRRIG